MSFLSAPYFHDEAEARKELEATLWPHGPVCPRCGGMDRITTVKGGRPGLRRCGPCKRQFTVTVGTVFESGHVKLSHWLQAVYLTCSSKKGVSSHQLMRILDVQYKTAWFMSHRIREAMKAGKLPPLGGLGVKVEIDETFTQATAHSVVRNVNTTLSGPLRPYQELGSVEGYLQGVELDGFGRRVAYVRERITGELVKCVFLKSASQLALNLSARLIGDVWRRTRIQVSGRICYSGPGRIDRVEATDARFLRARADLPQIDDVIDEAFTNGLRSEEYLERLRAAEAEGEAGAAQRCRR